MPVAPMPDEVAWDDPSRPVRRGTPTPSQPAGPPPAPSAVTTAPAPAPVLPAAPRPAAPALPPPAAAPPAAAASPVVAVPPPPPAPRAAERMSFAEAAGLLTLLGLLLVGAVGLVLFSSSGRSPDEAAAQAAQAEPVAAPPRVPVKKKLDHDPLAELNPDEAPQATSQR